MQMKQYLKLITDVYELLASSHLGRILNKLNMKYQANPELSKNDAFEQKICLCQKPTHKTSNGNLVKVLC